ncbi:MAG: hypothetical protein BWY44_00105 [Candidatus Omnitrophica bacterium ADurb.Bin292]|nr:MAG: hypothetical protein BWY44_00105 [Candidatus Omnitrophica bacterium ADurb.Bin292]
MILNIPDQPILILAHLEKIIALPAKLRGDLMIGTLSVHELRFHIEALAAYTIITLILAEIDIPGIKDLLQDHLNRPYMAGVGRADKIIIGYGKLRPEIAELLADAVRILFRLDAGLVRRFGYFIPVLVRAGHEVGLIAAAAVKTREHIGDNRCIGMPDVGRGIYIIYRCSDVKDLILHSIPSIFELFPA